MSRLAVQCSCRLVVQHLTFSPPLWMVCLRECLPSKKDVRVDSRQKCYLNHDFGSSLSPKGLLLGPLGSSWTSFGPLWCPLSSFWTLLGSLGILLGHTWLRLGAIFTVCIDSLGQGGRPTSMLYARWRVNCRFWARGSRLTVNSRP